MLSGKDLQFSYDKRVNALDGISFDIFDNEIVAIIGKAGAGKTTLIKHMNKLLKANKGLIYYNGENIYDKKYKISNLRKKVALVFQYPEQQLFKKTVIEDVMFGPLNLGCDNETARQLSVEALNQVGYGKEFYERDPQDLSGGEKRCIAIAGVLAMKPNILILDEVAAGLDPETKNKIFDLIVKIKNENKISIVIITHNMDDVLKYADRMLIIDNGKKILEGKPKEIFTDDYAIKNTNISIPTIMRFIKELNDAGIPIDKNLASLRELGEAIVKVLGNKDDK